MRIYLARHASCVNSSPIVDEFDRYLTIRGRSEAKRSGQIMREQGARLAVILTSPLARAIQTAELIAGELGFEGEVRTTTSLGMGVPPAACEKEVRSAGGDVLLVGHAPDMGMRTTFFLGGTRFPTFFKSMVACVALEVGKDPYLDWAYRPDRDEVVGTIAEVER